MVVTNELEHTLQSSTGYLRRLSSILLQIAISRLIEVDAEISKRQDRIRARDFLISAVAILLLPKEAV